jgi:hypothetical protein
MFLQFSNFQSETSANRRNTGPLCVTDVTANIVLFAIIAGEGWREEGSQPWQIGLECSVRNVCLTFPGLPPKMRMTLELNLSTSGNGIICVAILAIIVVAGMGMDVFLCETSATLFIWRLQPI